MNEPYVKKYDENGILKNPLGVHFISPYPNRRARRAKEPRQFNNKKGVQLVVRKIGSLDFYKARKMFQKVGNKTIVHYVEHKSN